MIKPVFAITPIDILFEPNTIALGGVATGSMNAIDALTVAGSISKSGLICILTERPANMGKINCVVAVFDVTSVRNVIPRQITSTIIKWC